MYSLTVLEARSLRSRHWQDHTPSEDSRDVSLPLTSGDGNSWCPLPGIHITSVSAVVIIWPPSVCVCMCVCVCVCARAFMHVVLWVQISLLMRTSVFGFRAHLKPAWLHLNLSTSAKTPSQIRSRSQVPGTGTWACLLLEVGGQNSTHYTKVRPLALNFFELWISPKNYCEQ